jgi:hypothetical protein
MRHVSRTDPRVGKRIDWAPARRELDGPRGLPEPCDTVSTFDVDSR